MNQQPQQPDLEKTKKALAIVKALAFTENGGHPNSNAPKAGKTGEMKSIFQFEPGTWKGYAKEVTGHDNVPLNSQTEAAVVFHKVQQWLDQGYNVKQIASIWNSGKPDAYKQNWKGVNSKYGVAYNTPAYADKVESYAEKFGAGSSDNEGQPASPQGGNTAVSDKVKQIQDIVASSQKQAPKMAPMQPQMQPQAQTNPGMLPQLLQANQSNGMKQARQV